jgi:membrane-bound lytic murein transglycosylase B
LRNYKFIIIGLVVFLLAETILPVFADEKAELERQLQEVEAQIQQYQNELNAVQGEKNTLQNKINQLKKQQSALNLQIRSTNLKIQQIGGQIFETQSAINDRTNKALQLETEIAEFIRAINDYDDFPIIYSFISDNNLFESIAEIERQNQILASIKSLLSQVLEVKQQLNQQKEILANQQGDAKNLLAIKSLQQQSLSGSVSEQNSLLKVTKGKESNYQAVIADKQKAAAQIRGRLYVLLGVTTQVTFGEALEIAKWASQQTGVRAAFLLAILTQESNLGKNVGTCNRAGDPPSKSWKVVMKPTRDQEPFKTITSELGLDIDTTPVSCPMRDSSGNQVGWGGAMGPAQFIPSTWMGYRDKVTTITGRTANPWDIRDAFLASAIKLKAGGAGTVKGEWAAAMIYFSGSTNTRFRFYGDNVVALANKYQAEIDSLE